METSKANNVYATQDIVSFIVNKPSSLFSCFFSLRAEANSVWIFWQWWENSVPGRSHLYMAFLLPLHRCPHLGLKSFPTHNGSLLQSWGSTASVQYWHTNNNEIYPNEQLEVTTARLTVFFYQQRFACILWRFLCKDGNAQRIQYASYRIKPNSLNLYKLNISGIINTHLFQTEAKQKQKIQQKKKKKAEQH